MKNKHVGITISGNIYTPLSLARTFIGLANPTTSILIVLTFRQNGMEARRYGAV